MKNTLPDLITATLELIQQSQRTLQQLAQHQAKPSTSFFKANQTQVAQAQATLDTLMQTLLSLTGPRPHEYT